MKKNALFPLFFAILMCFPIFGQRINDLTGINAHAHKDPIWAQKRFSWIREWHDWSSDIGFAEVLKDETDPMNIIYYSDSECLSMSDPTKWKLKFNPSYNQATNPLSFDNYYNQIKSTSNVVTVMKGIAPILRGHGFYPNCTNAFVLEQKPVCLKMPHKTLATENCWTPTFDQTLDVDDQKNIPASFKEHALWLSLYASKFGTNKYTTPINTSSFFKSEEVLGKKLVKYMEDNNETNKSWVDQGIGASHDDFLAGKTVWYFSFEQYASMYSIDYDGHLNTTLAGGPLTGSAFKVGVTNAASDITLIQAGSTGLNGAYYKKMRNHFGTLRGSIPPMVANFHHYCTNLSDDQNTENSFLAKEFGCLECYYVGTSTDGVHPEQDLLKDKLKWTKNNLGFTPENGYWLSEFGYDSFNGTNDSGVAVDFSINGGDAEKTQAQWLTRGVLETAASQSIDKMMLYELKDDPTRGDDTYARSGLLTGTDAKKKSWYYIMTLKKVLGEYKFNAEVTDGSNSNLTNYKVETSPSNQDCRIYEFLKSPGLPTIYAIWSPTGAGVNFTVDLTIDYQNAELSILNPILHRITDFSEVGSRTLVDPNNIVGNTIKEIPVSETPIFLVVNSNYKASPQVPKLDNFMCSPMGCNSMQLSWKPSATTRTVRIFYKEVNNCNSCTEFKYNDVTVYPFEPGVGRTSIVVNGLKKDATYCFYAIPVSIAGNTEVDISNVVHCCSKVEQQDCLLEIKEDEIGFAPGYAAYPGLVNNFKESIRKLLSIDATNNSCENLVETSVFCTTPNSDTEDWSYWFNPNGGIPNANSFEINFTTPKKLNAVYYQDWLGTGYVTIEYKSCDCPNLWKPLKVLTLTGAAYCDGMSPVVQSLPLNAVVLALRVSRQSSDATIRRLFFCGEDAVCPIKREFTPLSNLYADEIRKDNAVLRWDASALGWETGQPDFLDKYQLQVSENIHANGELAAPITTIEVFADTEEPEVMYRLHGLAPATTYHATIIPSIEEIPCNLPLPRNVSIVSFTTEGGRGEGRNEEISNVKKIPNNVNSTIKPNPTNGGFEVSIQGDGKIDYWILMDLSGKILKSSTKVNKISDFISIESLPEGIYWLKLVTQDGKRFTNKIVKS
jgi:hypothetical protein